MVDYIQPQLRRDSARLPYDTDTSYPNSAAPYSTRSRRSSVSSFAESEFSVFSDVSITSSQTSASTRVSAGWGSSPPDDSDEENYSSLYEDNSEYEARVNVSELTHNYVTQQKKEQATSVPETTHIKLDSHPNVPIQPVNNYSLQGLQSCQSSNNTQPSQLHGQSRESSHPRRTTVDASWSKPNLVTQHERRVNFVENLVDSATQLVALIWPLAMTEVCTSGRQPGTPVITLRFFIRETLRRSRTSFSTLQVAMYYLALLNYGGQIPKGDQTSNQALHCGRRMFLASLILASKYLQDRNYFTKAWSRISNLSVAEINRNEMALLSALEYKLHIKPCSFQKWTDGVSACCSAVQQGVDCPWVEVLMFQNLWRPLTSCAKLTVGTPEIASERQRTMTTLPRSNAQCNRPSAVLEHRLGLAGIGQSVCPTKPFSLPVRACSMGKPNIQWHGMATHLQPRYRGPSANLVQGVSQIFLQEQDMSNEPNRDETAHVSQSSLLSPPKTPEFEDASVATENIESAHQRPPPTPKEPLLSLNTTPDSNDGASTFGNYLGPLSEHSPTSSNAETAPSHMLPESRVARCKADTLGTEQEAADGAHSARTSSSSIPTVKSLDLSSPYVERVTSSSSKDLHIKRGIAAAVHADLESSETWMDVTPDTKPSNINTSVQERTRRLLNSELPTTHDNDISTSRSAVIEDDETDEKYCRSDAKHRRSVKHEKCQRRKRPAGSFSNDQGLSFRTKKVPRA